MSITFQQAPEFTEGNAVRADEHGLLADAFNDRWRIDWGNPAYRTAQYFARLWRLVRYPDESFFPAFAEFLEAFIHVDPRQSAGEWPDPDSVPDVAEGANLGNPAMAFVLGDRYYEEDEGTRLSNVPISTADRTNLRYLWTLGKQQRGAFDPSTLAMDCPTFTAAQSYFRTMFPSSTGVTDPWQTFAGSFTGKSYGGYLPVSERDGISCSDGEQPITVKFTKLSDSSTLSWLTACSDDTTSSDRVRWVTAWPFAYYVFFADGSLLRLDRKAYIEGPYTSGGRLQKAQGEQVARILLNSYVGAYRGTPSQRTGEFCITDIGFDLDAFFRSQYYLAPAKGSESEGNVTATYPSFGWDSDQESGAETAAHQIHADCTAAIIYTQADGLLEPVQIQVLNGSTVVDSWLVTPNEDGEGTVIVTYPDSWQPNLKFKLASDLTLDEGGELQIEVAELLDYKPEIHDAYLVLRLSSCRSSASRVDGPGYEEEYVEEAFAAYASSGTIVNQWNSVGVDSQVGSVNHNPVLEHARQFTRSLMRVIPRGRIKGYAVESGKSVLWVDRYLTLGGDEHDTMDGIADAIAHTPPARGETNEWVGFFQLFAYNPSEESIWKPSSYADIFTFNEPAHFYSTELNATDLQRHFQEGPPYATYAVAPESASAYSYAEGKNNLAELGWTEANRLHFYRSRMIYKKPYEIESAEYDDETGLVKLTFTARFQHHHELTEDIDADVSEWDAEDLAAEPYRTDENAVREYLLYLYDETPASNKIGDKAATSFLDSSDVKGTCFPRLFLHKLVPKPAPGALVTYDRFAQMELYLRAMCEGCVDGETSTSVCDDDIDAPSNLYDFTFENLCHHAFGGRWIAHVPPDVRTDMPQGFGPLPCLRIYAEGLNQISACVNKLTKVRVPLPYTFRWRMRELTGTGSVAGDWPSGVSCPAGYVIAFNATLPSATNLVTDYDEWADGVVFAATTTGGIDISTCVSGGFATETNRTEIQYKIEQTDDDHKLALPSEYWPHLTDMRFVGRLVTDIDGYEATATNDSGEAGDYWNGTSGYSWGIADVDRTVECKEFSTGTLSGGASPPSGLVGASSGSPTFYPRARTQYITGINLLDAYVEADIEE